MSETRKLSRTNSGLGLAIALVSVMLLAAIGIAGYFALSGGPSTGVMISIKPGSSSGDIANVLAENEVINNAFLFKLYIKKNGSQDKLQAGKYEMKTKMTFAEALAALVKGPRIKYYTVTIPEGLTVDKTADRVAAATPIKKDAFLSAARASRYDFAFLRDAYDDSLEGFLFPKTYTVTDETKAEDLITIMLRQFSKETETLDISFAKERGWGMREVTIAASIIEMEVKVPDERPLVSAVIYNRLSREMLLQMCATVEYALPERKDELTYADLEYDSPYNTYLHPGLPPGPIASPGLASLQAAVAPASVDYLYYVLTGSDGSHTFTASYDEFERVKKERGL